MLRPMWRHTNLPRAIPQLQAGDAYFREGPFINDFAEISPDTLFGLGGNNATSFGSFGAPYCKPDSGPIRRYCSVADVR